MSVKMEIQNIIKDNSDAIKESDNPELFVTNLLYDFINSGIVSICQGIKMSGEYLLTAVHDKYPISIYLEDR